MSCARIFVSNLHSLEWVGLLLARVAVGLLFFLSGRAKLFVPERQEQMQTLMRFWLDIMLSAIREASAAALA